MLPDLALMGRELDRSKGAGETHDKERDPGHYIDIADELKATCLLGFSAALTREQMTTRKIASAKTRKPTPVRSSKSSTKADKRPALKWRVR